MSERVEIHVTFDHPDKDMVHEHIAVMGRTLQASITEFAGPCSVELRTGGHLDRTRLIDDAVEDLRMSLEGLI